MEVTMAKKTQKTLPLVFETFSKLNEYRLRDLMQEEPYCWNGMVAVNKYRVTIEVVEEPTDVVAERLRKLWRECDNMHDLGPLRAEAAQLGIELSNEERKKRCK